MHITVHYVSFTVGLRQICLYGSDQLQQSPLIAHWTDSMVYYKKNYFEEIACIEPPNQKVRNANFLPVALTPNPGLHNSKVLIPIKFEILCQTKIMIYLT